MVFSILVAIIVVSGAVGIIFSNKVKSAIASASTKGSAFVRVAEHDTQILSAKGQIIALQAAEKVTNAALSELEAAAAEVHAGREAIDSRIAKLTARL